METIGVVGVAFRRDGSDVLARFTIPKEERVERLPAMARQLDVEELVYLATCNRVELIFKGRPSTPIETYRRRVFRVLTGAEPQPGEAERTFRAWAGEGALEHLFLVASGLDSAQLGEQEIRTQVREALKMARTADVIGPVLDQVVTVGLRLGADINSRLQTRVGGTSLADVATDRIKRRVRRTGGPVALVGISPMTVRAAHILVKDGIEVILVNRTLESAAPLAEKLGLAARPLGEFRSKPDAVEALLTATGSPDPIFSRADLERIVARTPSGEPPLAIDMALPPDVDPDAAVAVGVERVGMDEINAEAEANRNRRLLDMAPAREMVDERLEKFCRQFTEKSITPVIARLNQRYRQTAVEGLERLFRKELDGLDDAARETITRWTEVMARRFAHIPTMGLRALATEIGTPAVRVFLDASGEDFLNDPVVAPGSQGEAAAKEDA